MCKSKIKAERVVSTFQSPNRMFENVARAREYKTTQTGKEDDVIIY